MSNRDASAVENYRRRGHRLIKQGKSFQAHDLVAEGLSRYPGDVRLLQLQALALARLGVTAEAVRILDRLSQEGHTDEETLGILGRTHKDLALQASGPTRARHLRAAREAYASAYAGNQDHYWTGINAASVTALLGRKKAARTLAAQVRKQCLAKLNDPQLRRDERYWVPATLGEAALVLGDIDEAERRYRQAARAAGRDWGSLNSMRRQARLLSDFLVGKRKRVDSWFPIPSVVVCVGHMIDRPNRPTPRFPAQLETAVKDSIRQRLRKLNAGIGFASGACGSDILFLEAMHDLTGAVKIVLPYKQEQFIKDSVDVAPEGDWGKRLEALLAEHPDYVTASQQALAMGSVTYDYASLIMHGMAAMHADALGAELRLLAVWDGQEGDGHGGTATIVGRWQAAGHKVEVVDITALRQLHCPSLTNRQAPRPAATRPRARGAIEPLPREIKAILFGDVVKYSQLTEEQIPPFVEHFLGTVARLVNTSPYPPVVRNTWGDALYFTFDRVADAGHFALDLCERLRASNWAALGLGEDLQLRVALHAGPVFACTDPIIKQRTFTGAHVSRAARIEPVTPPGQVFASQEFAALAALFPKARFRCDYAGRIQWSKNYGVFPTFHVRRARAALAGRTKKRLRR